ncbi:MAG TPA: D-aminoacyl-tRNA deacylase [Balneolales bacterium]|nr:D-aminoacyl-tRNA deacylase [Balneolales bacterium]
MRIVLQRVSRASVTVENKITGKIDDGLLLLVGIHPDDTEETINWMGLKILRLRVFEDGEKKMNLSVSDVKGGILVISQFTLYADTRKGTRPGFSEAAGPEFAKMMYEKFLTWLQVHSDLRIQTGVFGAMMNVDLVNKGPVTIILDK